MKLWTPRQKPVAGGLRLKLGTYKSSQQWRSDPILVEAAARALSSDPLVEMLGIMQAEAPLRIAPLPAGASETDVIRAYGVESGYQFALRRLLSLAEPIAQPQDTEPTFPNDL